MKSVKSFHQYLAEPTSASISYDQYLTSPGTAFLKYANEVKDAIVLCKKSFPKNKGGEKENSRQVLEHLIIAVIPAIMGHFETFQRFLFAGLFDFSIYIKGFEIDRLLKKIAITIDQQKLSAYRGIGQLSIGILLADHITKWHTPKHVNDIFKAFSLKTDIYSNDDQKQLSILWQFRHSIVHTAGTITHPDSKKISALNPLGGTQIAFSENFIYEVSRKLHPIVQKASTQIGNEVLQNLNGEINSKTKKKNYPVFQCHK